ncbi:hypothetical protein UFOVP181_145 [uncultured Caudovirales phage]|uniref:Uncharacterized protein n=1 Tax=uncultured Caudovirales phage TaxID=2100421 RepID=A0A6J7WEB8_9CAUD|nr:hypothetical protein UFOVP57_17 [uncultured Caudovirales phage]CAB5208750.1 hypothetical protein UFOVP181_145 [uncultured Caudovirales phage]
MKHSNIDYTNLNKRIVEQAYSGFKILSESEKRKLIQEKLDRAVEYHKSLQNTKFEY